MFFIFFCKPTTLLNYKTKVCRTFYLNAQVCHHNRNKNTSKTYPVWQNWDAIKRPIILHVKVPFSRTGGSYFSAGMTGNPSACRFRNRKPCNDSNEDMRHDTFPGVAGGLSLSICRRAHII